MRQAITRTNGVQVLGRHMSYPWTNDLTCEWSRPNLAATEAPLLCNDELNKKKDEYKHHQDIESTTHEYRHHFFRSVCLPDR